MSKTRSTGSGFEQTTTGYTYGVTTRKEEFSHSAEVARLIASKGRFNRFCNETTVHGLKEFAQFSSRTAKFLWLLLFLGIMSVIILVVKDTTIEYIRQDTTTDFTLETTDANQYHIIPVCVQLDRMVHSSWKEYNVSQAAAWYLQQQWFSWMLQSDGLDYSINNEDLYIFENYESMYFPYLDKPILNNWTWTEIREYLREGIQFGEEAIQTLISKYPQRYTTNVTQLYNIGSKEQFDQGGFLPLAVDNEVVRGPYTSGGAPYFVCWDIHSKQTTSGNQHVSWTVRVWADQDVDGALWLFFYAHFHGHYDVFGFNNYYPVEYPDRTYSTKEQWLSYNVDVYLLRNQDRRTYSCAHEKNIVDVPRYPDNHHKQRCLDNCIKRYIENRFNCSFKAGTLDMFCHQYHLEKQFLLVDDWLSFFTDNDLKAAATKLYNMESLQKSEAYGHSHLLNKNQRPHLMLGFMFRQVFIDASTECQRKCESRLPYCDVYKFYSQNTVQTMVSYAGNERNPPKYNVSGHPSDIDSYDVHIVVTILPAYSQFLQVVLMNFDDYISNLGGLSGFYLGASVLSVIHMLLFICCTPCARRSEKRRGQRRKAQNTTRVKS